MTFASQLQPLWVPASRRVTILLLSWAWVLSSAMWSVAAETTAPRQSTKTILILGDSLAAGYGIDPEEAFPALLQQKINQEKRPYRVVNAGVSGDTSAGGLSRIKWLLKRPVDILILELGGNDGLRGISPAYTKTNLQGIIDQTRQANPRVQILIAGMRMPANYGEDYVGQFAAIFPDLARRNDAALIPFLLEGVGGSIDLNLPDRIHPTPAGHRLVAENVWRILQPLLDKSR